MKVFFKAIRQYDYDKVKNYLDKKPELSNCIAKQPPKKDDGQSALQIAFKTDNLEIADLLIERNADINYIDNSEINGWNIPVFHDFIIAITCNLNESNEIYLSYMSMLKNLISKKIDFYICDSSGKNSFNCLIKETDSLYGYQHKRCWDTKQGKYILSKKQKDQNLEKRLKEVYSLFLDEYLKKETIAEGIKNYSTTTHFDKEFKIYTFSMELLNELLIEKQGSGLINFENKK